MGSNEYEMVKVCIGCDGAGSLDNGSSYTGVPLRIVQPFKTRATGPLGTDSFAVVRHRNGREGGFWYTNAPLLWEILSRGNPVDAIPEGFEPERDAEGRPVLERSGQALVMQRPERESPSSAFRAAQCDEFGHTWNQATEICDHCGARLSVEVARGRAELRYTDGTPAKSHCIGEGMKPLCGGTGLMATKPHQVDCEDCRELLRNDPDCPVGLFGKKAPDVTDTVGSVPSLHERYAAFRATVERVVAEEAPRATVVTDWSGTECQAWLLLDDVSFAFQLEMGGSLGAYLEQDVRNLLADFRYQLGAAAMGAKR